MDFTDGASTSLLAAAGVGAAVLGAGIYACMSLSQGKGLKAPIRKSDIPPGTSKEVQLADKVNVLLVHTADGHIFATGTKCPHVGAPMEKGVVSGHRIVCPWHAACFDVSCGDIEDGPSLNALPTYEAIVDASGDIFVKLPKSGPVKGGAEPSFVKQVEGDARHFVMVGAGAATAAAIETLRHEGYTGRITLIGKEKYLAYDRPKLSKAMSSTVDQIVLRQPAFYEKLGVTLRLGVSVTAVRTETREVVLDTKEVLQYDKLLCATGGAPRRFVAPEPFVTPGAELGNIFPLRDAPHSQQIEEAVAALKPEDPIVILGSSFIGMEAAAYLAQSKGRTNITVLGMESVPFERVLGKEVGSFMLKQFTSRKVKFQLGPDAIVTQFKGDGGQVSGVKLKNGMDLPAKMVIIGAGIIPATDFLATAKGVEVLTKAPGGVRVNEFMQTGAPDVYAAGDIAYFPYKYAADPVSAFTRIEHWDVAFDQGRVAALNMMGKVETPYASVPFFWTSSFGTQIRYAGNCHKPDRVVVHGNPAENKFVVYYIVGDAAAAVATIGRDPYAVAAMELIRINRMPTARMLDADLSFDLPAYLTKQTVDMAVGTSAGAGKR